MAKQDINTDTNNTLNFITSHGYRVNPHMDGSCTVYIFIGTDGDEVGYHARSLEQAKQAIGY